MRQQFDEIIKEMTESLGNPDDELILSLKAKRDEVDDFLDEEEADRIITEMLENYLAQLESKVEELGGSSEPYGADDITSAADEGTANAGADESAQVIETSETAAVHIVETTAAPGSAESTVKAYLDKNKWHYSTRKDGDGRTVFEFNLNVKKVPLSVKIYTRADNGVCTIEAVLMITCDPVYRYPFNLMLSKLNYSMRYGAFKYDERDGRVAFEYATRTQNGLSADDLDIYFNAVVNTAAENYNEIRRYCVGKFKPAEKKEIIDIIKVLIGDLDSPDGE